jgi:hypothetical protein
MSSLFTPTRDRAMLLSWIVAACFAVVVISTTLTRRDWMLDAHSYWQVWSHQPMYDLPPGTTGAYLYSPAFAQLIWPLTLLPWWLFSVVWFVASCATYLWLVRPIGWVWGVPLLALALEDVTLGNTTWLIALACAVGLRRSAAWTVPLLIKVTPAVGALWHVARRDLRAVLELVGVSAGIVLASWLLAPELWSQWFSFLSENRDPGVALRVVAAAAIVLVAARLERGWLLPLALLVASPVLAVYLLAFACAVPRLLDDPAIDWARAPFGGLRATLRRALDLDHGSRGAGADGGSVARP